MTIKEAHATARDITDIVRLVQLATALVTIQRRWLITISQRLIAIHDTMQAIESQLMYNEPSVRQAYKNNGAVALDLIRKVDIAYVRVFGMSDAYEDCFQHCDGETTFAISEALYRLRAIAAYSR